jgi:hypothetical protein
MKCGIVTSRLFTKPYILLILITTAVIYGIGLLTHFTFEGITVGVGIVATLLGTYYINRQTRQNMEMMNNGYNIVSPKRTVTYSYDDVLGILKDNSMGQVDFRYRMVTTDRDYLLDTNQKDVTENVISTIGFREFDPQYAKDTVCWKRLPTDKFVFKKNLIEVMNWSDRMSFMQFQVAIFSACTLFLYFILKLIKIP